MTNIREAREARGIRQCAVADYVGVNRLTYARYEEDQDKMSVEKAKKACEFMGYDFAEIFLQ